MRILLIFILVQLGVESLAQKPYTPPPGSTERKEILDILRKDYDPRVLFIVNHFLIKRDWACLSVLPQLDKKDYSEPFWVLLSKKGGRWVKMNWTEGLEFEDEFDVIDLPKQNGRVAKMIVRKYPDCPMDIFSK
jgi:hypothetical protein